MLFFQENISAVQARDTYKKRQDNLKEKEERQKLLEMGENPDEVLTRRKRLRQFEREKQLVQLYTFSKIHYKVVFIQEVGLAFFLVNTNSNNRTRILCF